MLTYDLELADVPDEDLSKDILDSHTLVTLLNPSLEMVAWMLNNPDFDYIMLAVENRTFYIAPKKNSFFSFEAAEDYPASPTSAAEYVAVGTNGLDGLLFQFLPPNSQTSKHLHRENGERFVNFYGPLTVEIDGKYTILEGDSLLAEVNQTHQLSTGNQGALTLCQSFGNPSLDKTDHVYS